MRRYLAAAVALSIGAGLSPFGAAEPRAADLVRAEILVEPGSITPGKPFSAGIRLTTRPGWHTYWRNPGDSGLATTVQWRLPEGFGAGEIQWPVPERIPVGPLVNFGYENAVVLLATLTPPATLGAGTVEIAADVDYLVCERVCIPGDAKLAVRVPAATDAARSTASPETERVFAEARSELPTPAPWPVRFKSDGEVLRLALDAPGLRAETIRSTFFFPYDDMAVEHAAPQKVSVGEGGLTLELKRSALSTSPPTAANGVLVLEENSDGTWRRQALRLGDEPVAPRSSAAAETPARQPEVGLGDLLTAAGLAFLGGLLLNLMPCVFPVLSIKVMSLARHSGLSAAAVRLHGLAYGIGVVASFGVLAAVLLAVRSTGAEVGWGYQLQQPIVVAVLAFLLFAMGLSLSGVAEFGAGLASLGGRGKQDGLGGSFLTGVLATVVATPCTAPFMGAAVGYAVAAPAAGAALAVFLALGIGMALPFVVLTFSPALVNRLPKPGAWMATLKGVLAFPIYATVAWLIFVVSQQVGPDGLFAVLLGLVLVGLAVWTYGLAAGREGWRSWLARGTAVAALAGLVGIGAAVSPVPEIATAASSDGSAEPFTQARLDALRAQGRPVFVNMTAAWCITCLVNERTTLSTDAVRDAFRARNVAYLKGDWTNRNPEITRLLERHGRSGVPLYVLYPERGEPVILPQILTQAGILDDLGRLSGVKRASLEPTTQQGAVR